MWLRNRHYKDIVAMGRAVVPCILHDLDHSLASDTKDEYPGWWAMYALPEITGVRIKVGGPEVKQVGGFAAVDVDGVSRFWIDWARREGIAF